MRAYHLLPLAASCAGILHLDQDESAHHAPEAQQLTPKLHESHETPHPVISDLQGAIRFMAQLNAMQKRRQEEQDSLTEAILAVDWPNSFPCEKTANGLWAPEQEAFYANTRQEVNYGFKQGFHRHALKIEERGPCPSDNEQAQFSVQHSKGLAIAPLPLNIGHYTSFTVCAPDLAAVEENFGLDVIAGELDARCTVDFNLDLD